MVKDYFPVEEQPGVLGRGSREDAAYVSHILPANNAAAKDGVVCLVPGQKQLIFSRHDILGTLPPEFQLVADRAAQWVGVETDDLCAVVERMERRALRWWGKERKRGHLDGSE